MAKKKRKDAAKFRPEAEEPEEVAVKGKSAWKDTHYVTIYQLACQDMFDASIAKSLGVKRDTFQKWKNKYPAIQDALDRGRNRGKDGNTIIKKAYKRMPERARKAYDKVMSWQKSRDVQTRVERMFSREAVRIRQYVCLQALMSNGYHIGNACKFVGIDRSTFQQWVKNDEDFAVLVDETMELLKDDFQMHLYQQSESGEVQATKFALQSLAKDRGFGNSSDVNVNVNGNVQHNHLHLKIDELDLPVETRKQVLEAIRQKKLEGKVINETY